LSLHRLTWPRQHPLGSGQPPVSGRLYGTRRRSGRPPLSRFPDAFRPPAFASWPSCSRRGFGLPHGRPTGQQRCRISTGFPRSTRARNDRGGRPLYPGDGGVLPVEGSLFNRHLPLPSGQSLHPADTSHRRDPNVTRHPQGFTRVHPSGLPLACDPRMGRGSLGFFPELRTPPLPATHVRAGTGHGHWPGTTPSTSVEPPIGAFTHLVRPRVAPSRRSRSARSLRSTAWASNAERRAACLTDC
jgi:hypothetical protein